jgi:D-2-hydroxyacid dehydrogenase (NADP+)
MSKLVVLVMLSPDDPDSESYRAAISDAGSLSERVELRFSDTGKASGLIADAEVVVCGSLSDELLAQAINLKWISFWTAGLEGKATPEIQERGINVTNASGVHGPNIAEHVMAFMLMFTRGMPHFLRAQLRGAWESDDIHWGSFRISELTGQTLGIVGLGRIGEVLAERARSFNMRVVATKRDPTRRYNPEITLDAIYSHEELPRLLNESDHVCVCVPYTQSTHRLLNEKTFNLMKDGSYLYNISRGKIIDEAALVAALASGKLRGAGLDVFETEPLPASSPLWAMENVLITPHVAGLTPYYFSRAATQFADNLMRYVQGEPLHNLFKPTLGY